MLITLVIKFSCLIFPEEAWVASFIKRENEEETIRNRDLRKRKDEIEGKVSNLALFFFSKRGSLFSMKTALKVGLYGYNRCRAIWFSWRTLPVFDKFFRYPFQQQGARACMNYGPERLHLHGPVVVRSRKNPSTYYLFGNVISSVQKLQDPSISTSACEVRSLRGSRFFAVRFIRPCARMCKK